MNQIKEKKISFETNFKPVRHEIKTWSHLGLYQYCNERYQNDTF